MREQKNEGELFSYSVNLEKRMQGNLFIRLIAQPAPGEDGCAEGHRERQRRLNVLQSMHQ